MVGSMAGKSKASREGQGGRSASRRPAAHPLAGADLGTLLRVLPQAGPLPARAWPQVGLALGAAAGRLPFTLAERAWVAGQRRGRPLEPAPIFLVGHWRSGTTHLYNLLGEGNFATVDPIAAGLPWDFLLLGRLLRPLLVKALPEGRFIDGMAVNPDSPQEDELALANMSPLSFYHAIYFPRRFQRFFLRGLLLEGVDPADRAAWMRRADHFFWKVARQQGGRPLAIKNPVYTGRVALLAERYPQARFVHIVRNPHEVFASTRSFFAKLFDALALQPVEGLDPEAITLDTYPRLMEAFIAEAPRLSSERFVELRFEALEEDPMGTLRQLYAHLGLSGFEAAAPRFQAHLSQVRGYERAARQFPERDLELVERHWRRYLDHWGYGRPEDR